MRLRDKAAIVTGGSQGIGRAIALRFAAEGAAVAVVGRTQSALDVVVGEIEAAGGRAIGVSTDCSSVVDIQAMVAKVVDALGGVDILSNNAGVFRTVSIEATTEAIWDEQINLNLKGTFFLVQSVLPHMLAKGAGKIVLTSSIAGLRGFVNCPAYCASKAGVINFAKAAALELASRKININTIAPGNTETPINAHLRGPENAEYVKLMSDRTPTGRAFLPPSEVSGAAVFLASEDSNAVHGTTVVVDDGWCAW